MAETKAAGVVALAMTALAMPVARADTDYKAIAALGLACQAFVGDACERLARLATTDVDEYTREAAVKQLTDQDVLARVARNDGDAMVCRAAVERIGGQAVLGALATSHTDSSVRRAATARLTDQRLLGDIARTDRHHEVRIAAVGRLESQEALSAIAHEDPAPTVRTAAVAKLTDQAVLAELATKDQEPQVRAAAVERVSSQALLATVARGDRSFEVRSAATQRLSDEALLTQIAKRDPEWRVRAAAIRGITDAVVLTEIACEDKSGDVSLIAATKLKTDLEALTEIAKRAKSPFVREFARQNAGIPLVTPAPEVSETPADPVSATGEVRELLARLRSHVAAERIAAARALGEAGSAAEPAVPALARLLGDSQVRAEAALALGKLGPHAVQAVPALAQAVASGDPETRVNAAEALGKIGPQAKGSVATLTAVLDAYDGRLRSAAAVALARIDGRIQPLVDALGAPSPEGREAAAKDLCRIGTAAVEPALAALRDRRESVRAGAATALGCLGSSASRGVPALRRLLGDPSFLVRAAAAAGLGGIGAPAREAIPDLVQAMKSADCATRDGRGILCLGGSCPEPDPAALLCLSAGLALEALSGDAPETAAALGTAVRDKDEFVAEAAAVASGSARAADEALASLVKALKDRRPGVRAAAVAGLAELGVKARAALPGLAEALAQRTEAPDTREAIVRAMAVIGGPEAVRTLVARVEDPGEDAQVRGEAVRALGEIGPDAAAAIPSLTAQAERGSVTAAAALRKVGADAASPILVRMVGDRALDYSTRALCANEIRELGPAAAAAIPALVDALHDTGRGIEGVQKAELRRAAASALAKLGPEGVDALTVALRDPQRDVRQDAALGLLEIGPEATEAIPALVAALRDDDISGTIGNALAWKVKGPAVPFLMKTLEEPGGGPYMATEVLARIGAPAVPALVSALESPSLSVRRTAARILNQIGSVPEEALPAVIAVMNDSSREEEVRAAMPAILRRTPGSTAYTALVGGLASDSGAVRRIAAEQIGEIGPAAADAVPLLLKLLSDPAASSSAGRALERMGGTALAALEGVLRDSPDPSVRARALDAYSSVEPDPRKKLRVLTAALKEPSEPVRVMAARRLGSLGLQAGSAALPLAELLHDPSPAVRLEACQALAGLGTAARDATPGLRATLAADAYPNVRSGAAFALASTGRYAADNLPALVAALEDPNGSVRCSVAQALGRVGRAAAAAVPALEKARTKEEGLRCVDGALREIRGQRP